jgi:tetratricopeptide (TPR) repeat protein
MRMRLTGTLAAAALAVAAWLPAAALAAQTAAVDHVADGAAAAGAHRLGEALAHYALALEQDSLDAEANWRTALALVDSGKQTPDSVESEERDSLYDLAEIHARRAVSATPNDAQAHFILAVAIGRAALTKGTQERVRRATEIRNQAMRAIELDPAHDGAYHVLGRWNAEVMRLSGIKRFFAKSFLGADVFGKASWSGAVSNLERAVELNPTLIYHRLDLAQIYADVGRYGDARAQLQRAASLPETDVMDPGYKREAAALLAAIAGKEDRKTPRE